MLQVVQIIYKCVYTNSGVIYIILYISGEKEGDSWSYVKKNVWKEKKEHKTKVIEFETWIAQDIRSQILLVSWVIPSDHMNPSSHLLLLCFEKGKGFQVLKRGVSGVTPSLR